MQLPKDPYMLLSIVNMKLRDDYSSLSQLCQRMDIDEESLTKTLNDAGFTYNPETNSFN